MTLAYDLFPFHQVELFELFFTIRQFVHVTCHVISSNN